MVNTTSLREVARRLRRTRLALGYESQAGFARVIDTKVSRYNQYETGERLITLDVALRITERFGVTLDWIYRGDASGLPRRIDVAGEG